MRTLAITLLCMGLIGGLAAQTRKVYTIPADSTRLTGCDSNELIIENHTQNVPGFLFNTGNGRTVFKRGAQQLGDGSYLVGADTVKAWVQGGNAFGATGVLGTLDNHNIDLYTNGIKRARIDSLGQFGLDFTSAYSYGNAFSLTNQNGTYPWVNIAASSSTCVLDLRPNNYAYPSPTFEISTGYSTTMQALYYNVLSVKGPYGLDLYGGYGGGAPNGIRFFSNSSANPVAAFSLNGNLVVGNAGTDNGKTVQVNGKLFVSDSSFLSGFTLASTAQNSTISGGKGNSIMIGQPGANQNGFYNAGTGSVIIHAPVNSIGGLAGNISNSVMIGGNSCACSGTMSNSLVIAKDMGYEQVYNGALFRSNILALGGSSGLLRDDNTGGASYMLANFPGNIYIGYNMNNWEYAQDLPSNYIQIGGSGHNLLALFGGFHGTPPPQSTLAGPSFRREGPNSTFGSGSYFRVAAGRGTGTGVGSDLRFSVSPAGDSSSELNPYVDAISIAAATAYVGIGTTAPAAQLHTTGTVRFAGLTPDSTKTRVLVSDGSGNLFYRDASTLAANDLIRSSLAVNGPIKARELTLTGKDWPDYVFDSSYRLPALAEVKAYLARQHHLPGVPSAAEVQEKGVMVGENQAVLLRKIEELTLYTIRQDQQNAELKQQVTELKQQLAELTQLILTKLKDKE